jgi:hypothetical protein
VVALQVPLRREGKAAVARHLSGTGLKAARDKAGECKKLLGAGVDPGEARKAEKAGRLLLSANSFEAIARERLATVLSQRVSEGHSKRTRIRLEQDVFPWIGHLPIAEISAPVISRR